jgi:hypothetical protein
MVALHYGGSTSILLVCKDHKASLSFTVNQCRKARLSGYEPMCADCSFVMDKAECKSEVDQEHY